MYFRALRPVIALLSVSTVCAPVASGVDISRETFAGKTAITCTVELSKDHLCLFLKDDTGRPLKSFATLSQWLERQNKHLIFAMNAGMYEPDYSPVGLFISDGRQLNPLNLRAGSGNFYLRPNGVFALTKDGAVIVESSAFQAISHAAILATQSGPLLVSHGKIHPAFQPDSKSRLFRNGVGVTPTGRVVFAISEEPVNLYEFATLFRDRLHCPNALFLDGTVSSLYAPSLGRNDRKIDLGPMIGVVQ
jgi:uncharacterized protein YigE (DUF2233 family)